MRDKTEYFSEKSVTFQNLEFLAYQIVEGFISGMHKSPFHGFSSEFAEHKIYNNGESTKHIDWKLYARTDRLYVKQFEEETNMRCHFIIDNSSSMYYPEISDKQAFYSNKIGFSVLATAVLMNLLKRQRDAFGLSIYSDKLDYHTAEKGSERHHRVLLRALESVLVQKERTKATNTVEVLHQIAEKIHRRSMIVLFTDMFQTQDPEKLFEALQHLKYNKHKVIIFHVYSRALEAEFDFDNSPKKFIDIETGETVNLFSDTVKTDYALAVKKYFEKINRICLQYKIKYVSVAVEDSFDKMMQTYLTEKQKFR